MHERRFRPSQAHKLDDPERRKWLPPDEVLAALDLGSGQKVADIGAGTGYFTLPFAAAVGGDGRVFAVDVSPEMLERLSRRIAEAGIRNVECVEGEASATGLPAHGCDWVFMANVWHEFDDPAAVLREAARLLRAGGRIGLLDWRPDAEPEHGPPPQHRVTREAAASALREEGFAVQSAGNVGRYSWMLIAVRP